MADKVEKETEPLWTWIALIGISFIVYIGEGQVRIFGMFYVEWLELYDTTPVLASWVGTTFSIPNIIFSPFIGYMVDRWPMRQLVFVSGIIGAGGMLLAAFAPSIQWVIVGYGLLYGLSDCFSMAVALALINKYFDRHLALASGIAWCAGSIGGITVPFIIDGFNQLYSSRGTLIIIAGIRLNLSLAAMVLRPVSDLSKSKRITRVTEVSSPKRAVLESTVTHQLEHSLSNNSIQNHVGVNSLKRDDQQGFQMVTIRDNPAFETEELDGRTSMEYHQIPTDGSPKKTPNRVHKEELEDEDRTSPSTSFPRNYQPVSSQGSPTKRVANSHTDPRTDHSNSCLHDNAVRESQRSVRTGSLSLECKDNAEPSKQNKWKVLFRTIVNLKFITFSVFWFCGMMAFYGIIQFTPAYVEEFGYGHLTSILLGISGGADLLGRLLFGVIGDLPCTRINYAVGANMLLCGVGAVLTVLFPTLGMLVLFMVMMGGLGGSLWGLCGPLVVDAIGVEHGGLGAGIVNSLFGVATTVTPILIGSLREMTGSYKVVLYLGATAYFTCFVSFMIVGRRLPLPRCKKTKKYSLDT